jgi:hypothetical protein
MGMETQESLSDAEISPAGLNASQSIRDILRINPALIVQRAEEEIDVMALFRSSRLRQS